MLSPLLPVTVPFSPECPTLSPPPASHSAPVAAAAEDCEGRLEICSTLTHLHSLAIGNVGSLLPWAFLFAFGTVSGCWLIVSYTSIFHSKLSPIFSQYHVPLQIPLNLSLTQASGLFIHSSCSWGSGRSLQINSPQSITALVSLINDGGRDVKS